MLHYHNGMDMVTHVSRVVNGVTHEDYFLYDMWGNLAVHLRSNLDPIGGAPDDFGSPPRAEAARAWLRDEWHYHGDRLMWSMADRRPLDRDDSGSSYAAVDARFLRTDYAWRADGVITEVIRPNGASEERVYDGYGSLYKVTLRDSAATQSVVLSKQYVNDELELVKVVDGLGAATTIDRNAAGLVERVEDPATTALPTGYPFAGPAHLAVETQFDSMGRAVEVKLVEEPSGTDLLRRVLERDQIGRVFRVKVFEGSAGQASQVYTTTWSGLTTSTQSTFPGGRFVTREHDALARVTVQRDSRGGVGPNADHNEALFDYASKSPYLGTMTRRNYDEEASVLGYVERPVRYLRDEIGRVLTMSVGPVGAPLDHQFAYYTTGQTASYTDPLGKVERFLPDALGRLRERFLPGTQPIWNGTVYDDWTGIEDRTIVHLTDGLGHTTDKVSDWAGRMAWIMEPGSSVTPTPSAPHQPHARLFGYDAASRLVDVWGADDVHLRFERDAVGRLLQRSRVISTLTPLVSNLWGRDSLRRDAFGQIVELSSRTGLGPGGVGDEYIREVFDRDALGYDRNLWMRS